MWLLSTKNDGICLRPEVSISAQIVTTLSYLLSFILLHTTSGKGKMTFQSHRSERITSLVKLFDSLVLPQ